MKTLKSLIFSALFALPSFAQDLSFKTELSRPEYLDTTPSERYEQIAEQPTIKDKSVFVLGSFFEYPNVDKSLRDIKTQNPAKYFVKALERKVYMDRWGTMDVFSNREKNDYDENQELLKDYIRPKLFDALYGTLTRFNGVVKFVDGVARQVKEKTDIKFKTEEGVCFSARPYVNGLDDVGAQVEMKRFCGSDFKIRMTTRKTIFGTQINLGKVDGVIEAKFSRRDCGINEQVYLFYLTTK